MLQMLVKAPEGASSPRQHALLMVTDIARFAINVRTHTVKASVLRQHVLQMLLNTHARVHSSQRKKHVLIRPQIGLKLVDLLDIFLLPLQGADDRRRH